MLSVIYFNFINSINLPYPLGYKPPQGSTADSVFGEVKPPAGMADFTDSAGGFAAFINNFLNILIVGAGIYAVFNLVLAGYAFMSAGDDPKKVAGAWAKIWQTLLGLAIAAGAFILAALFGLILFGKADALLNIKIFTLGN